MISLLECFNQDLISEVLEMSCQSSIFGVLRFALFSARPHDSSTPVTLYSFFTVTGIHI